MNQTMNEKLESFTCHKCRNEFRTVLELRLHIDHAHSQGKYYNCTTCKKVIQFSSYLLFKEHLDVHCNHNPAKDVTSIVNHLIPLMNDGRWGAGSCVTDNITSKVPDGEQMENLMTNTELQEDVSDYNSIEEISVPVNQDKTVVTESFEAITCDNESMMEPKDVTYSLSTHPKYNLKEANTTVKKKGNVDKNNVFQRKKFNKSSRGGREVMKLDSKPKEDSKYKVKSHGCKLCDKMFPTLRRLQAHLDSSHWIIPEEFQAQFQSDELRGMHSEFCTLNHSEEISFVHEELPTQNQCDATKVTRLPVHEAVNQSDTTKIICEELPTWNQSDEINIVLEEFPTQKQCDTTNIIDLHEKLQTESQSDEIISQELCVPAPVNSSSNESDVNNIQNHNKCDTWMCPMCYIVCESERELLYHIHFKHGLLLCHLCYEEFDTKELLRYHNVSSHGNSLNYKYICHKCCYGFQTKLSLTEHTMDKHAEAFQFYCFDCNQGFRRRYALDTHTRECHISALRYYKCEFCGKVIFFSVVSHYQDHVAMHKSKHHRPISEVYAEDISESEICIIEDEEKELINLNGKELVQDDTSSNTCNFETHELNQMKHSEKISDNVLCVECGSQLNEETFIKHKCILSDNVGKWLCDDCGKEFLSEETFIKHTIEHNMETWLCDKCGIEFFSEEAFTQHICKNISANNTDMFSKCHYLPVNQENINKKNFDFILHENKVIRNCFVKLKRLNVSMTTYDTINVNKLKICDAVESFPVHTKHLFQCTECK